MKSSVLGKNISKAEIQDISLRGFWLLVKGNEYFVPFDEFPWFREAKLSNIYKVELHHGEHLYWPDLDIDLALESLQTPEKYPLIFSDR